MKEIQLSRKLNQVCYLRMSKSIKQFWDFHKYAKFFEEGTLFIKFSQKNWLNFWCKNKFVVFTFICLPNWIIHENMYLYFSSLCENKNTLKFLLIEKKGTLHVYFTDIEINIPACFLDLGLDTFKDNPEAASDYIKPLLQYVAGYIPQDQQKETLLFILATAGMRMIPEQWVNDWVRFI